MASVIRWLNKFLAFEFTSKIADELFVDKRVNVLAEKEENKPIPDLAFAGDQLDFVARSQTGLGSQQVQPGLGAKDDGQTVQQRQSGHHRQNDEPEPKENVDFFVDNVQRKNA